MNQSAVQLQGGNVPHTNIQPLPAVMFVIAINGVFPVRNQRARATTQAQTKGQSLNVRPVYR